MKPEKKGQLVGGAIGLVIGAITAYAIWGFNPPGGILILAGFGIGGLIGWNIGSRKPPGGAGPKFEE